MTSHIPHENPSRSEKGGRKTSVVRLQSTISNGLAFLYPRKWAHEGTLGLFHPQLLTISQVFRRKIEPHIAADRRGSSRAHMRVRMRQRGQPYYWSQRCRRKIEELFGEGKEFHGLRSFSRRRLYRVREETWLIGWVLNLKRLAKLLAARAAWA